LNIDRLLPKTLFALSKTFFDKSKACSRRLSADLPLRQDLLAKNVLMTAQRNFCLGNNPLTIDD